MMADDNESQSLCSAVNAMTLNDISNSTAPEQENRHNESSTQLDCSDLTTDGPLCDNPSQMSSSIDLPSLLSTPDSKSTTTTSFNDEIRDFVIVHTDKDYEHAVEFSEDLLTDAEDGTITIDLLEELDLGKSKFKSAKTLHDRYRFLLIFITDAFISNDKYKHLNEMLLDAGFNEELKKERVVPVFTKENCTIEELNIISGLNYFKRNRDSDQSKRSYRKTVKNLVKAARQIKLS